MLELLSTLSHGECAKVFGICQNVVKLSVSVEAVTE